MSVANVEGVRRRKHHSLGSSIGFVRHLNRMVTVVREVFQAIVLFISQHAIKMIPLHNQADRNRQRWVYQFMFFQAVFLLCYSLAVVTLGSCRFNDFKIGFLVHFFVFLTFCVVGIFFLIQFAVMNYWLQEDVADSIVDSPTESNFLFFVYWLFSVVNYLALLGVIIMFISYVYIIPWQESREEEEEETA